MNGNLGFLDELQDMLLRGMGALVPGSKEWNIALFVIDTLPEYIRILGERRTAQQGAK